MFISQTVSDIQTQPAQWTPAEREMCAITSSQVAGKDTRVLYGLIDGAGLGPKADSYLQVLDIAAIIEGLL